MNRKIIIIDDEESILNSYRMILSPYENDKKRAALEAALFGDSLENERESLEHYDLSLALQGMEGYLTVKEAKEEGAPFALAFVDIRMPPGWDGLKTAKKIRDVDPNIEIVIVTAYSDRERKEIVEKVGSPERLLYIKKPFDPEEIRQLALALTQKWELERKNEKYGKLLERLLESVRRLKTTDISSVRGVLWAILKEILYFVNSSKGAIIVDTGGDIATEVASPDISREEILSIIGNGSSDLKTPAQPVFQNEIIMLPLHDDMTKYTIVIKDAKKMDEDRKRLLGFLLDTSSEFLENVRKHERFLKNERVATIGQIAAGLIHEINNPLTSIIGAADLYNLHGERMWDFFDSFSKLMDISTLPGQLPERLGDLYERYDPEAIRQKMVEHFAIIHNGEERVRDLMSNIRNFSRNSDHFEPKVQDVSEAIDNTLLLAHNALKYGIKVHMGEKRKLMAMCDINGLKQVFLNLVLNATQAMEGNGELWIDGKTDNGKVVVTLRDTGPGISTEDRQKVFDAFFTTKSDGTGLGLSIVKGIIDKHNGVIRVESVPGKGTTFHVEIPSS